LACYYKFRGKERVFLLVRISRESFSGTPIGVLGEEELSLGEIYSSTIFLAFFLLLEKA
jgi:hypothetical protein